MIFGCMSDRELERWLYVNPNDEGAKAEALKRLARVPDLEDEIAELEQQVENLDCEAADLRDAVAALEQEVEELS